MLWPGHSMFQHYTYVHQPDISVQLSQDCPTKLILITKLPSRRLPSWFYHEILSIGYLLSNSFQAVPC